jgi:hypothetical protein
VMKSLPAQPGVPGTLRFQQLANVFSNLSLLCRAPMPTCIAEGTYILTGNGNVLIEKLHVGTCWPP